MAASTTNPLHGPAAAAPVSARTCTVAGILVTVHGLAELPPSTQSVACLWLLNPRLQTKEAMAPIAAQVLSAWNARISDGRAGSTPPGLIAAALDQRNHGTREVDELHNRAWREGNPRHAQDMFGCFHGTAVDTSQLMDHLESYIFTVPNGPRITQHMALGVSLGGHSVWHTLLLDPRITAGVVVIGCPDYARLMTGRARLSKRATYTGTSPPGASFLGSSDFPPALVSAVARYDPAGLLLPGVFQPVGPDKQPDEATLRRFRELLHERLQGKRILNLSGKDDKLVPNSAEEPFLNVFKQVLREDSSLDVQIEDVYFPGVGHSFSQGMRDKATDWLCELLARADAVTTTSKI